VGKKVSEFNKQNFFSISKKAYFNLKLGKNENIQDFYFNFAEKIIK